MTEVELVGGPHDGVRLTVTGDAQVIRMPVARPVEVARKVIPFGPDRNLSIDVAEYHRAPGGVYRWEGLISDAWCDMDVSEQVMAEGGPDLRAIVRQQMRRKLERMADKEVDRIVWRVTRVRPAFVFRVRALVGPRRVERGLRDRDERRAVSRDAADRLEGAG